jgi:hypothetical protein
MKILSHAYCDTCASIQPVVVEPLDHADTTGRFRGGDMVCTVCGTIIRTVYEPVADQATRFKK